MTDEHGSLRGGGGPGGSAGPERLARLQQTGQSLVLGLYSLLRTAGIHDVNNRALDRPVAQVLEALEPFVQRAAARFAVVALEGQVYVDDLRVRLPAASYHLGEELEALFQARGVGGLTFEGMPAADQLRRFASTLQHHVVATGREPLDDLRAALRLADVGTLGVTRPVRAQYEGEEHSGPALPSRASTTLAYAKAVTALSQLLSDPSGRAQVRRRQMSRVVREIADCAAETLEYLVGLTEHPSDRSDHSRLAVDTCVVAIALARSMRLPRPFIADVGAAVLGSGPWASGGEDEPLPPDVVALRQLAEAPRWSASLLRRTLIAAQRSLPVRDSSGQPDQHRLARLHRVARDYVALTHGFTPGSFEERDALTPLEALSFLSQCPASVYDPLVVAHLVRVVGIYPVGTQLRLTDGRGGYVVGRTSEGEPIVLLVAGPNRFAERAPLSTLGAVVAGIVTDSDPGQRAVAMLGADELAVVREAGAEIARGSPLARVRIQRVVVRRGGGDE
jgi:hypothetical protein